MAISKKRREAVPVPKAREAARPVSRKKVEEALQWLQFRQTETNCQKILKEALGIKG